ncbi:hypothetical protein, partial, partial [Parasitella parasitica]
EASTSGSMVTPDAELNPLVASHAESNYLDLPNDVNILYIAPIIIPVIGCRVKDLGCPLGTAVGIKPPRYDQIVAHGVLQNNNDLATIQVTKVNVPSWIAPPFADLQAGIALRSYGQPPFQMKIPIKYLITTVSSNPDVHAPVPSCDEYNYLVG